MAVQAQMYPDNLVMPFCSSLGMGGGAAAAGFSNNDLCFNLQHPQESQLQHQQQMQQRQQQFLLPQQLQNPQQKNQFLAFDDDLVFSAMKTQPSTTGTPITINQTLNNNNISMAFSQCISTQVEKQRREIDAYINLQNERLKIVLQEKRKRQFAEIVRKLDARAAMVVRQKDEEIAQAAKRTLELQEFLKRMEMENEAWRRVAGENEGMIANLNTAIEQLREKTAICLQQQPSNGDVEDAESCCDVNRKEEEEAEEGKTGENWEETGTREDAETGERNTKKRKTMMMVCRSCNSRNSSVLFLPCRHLCCCTACEAFLYACPVCNSAKKGSIEALLS